MKTLFLLAVALVLCCNFAINANELAWYLHTDKPTRYREVVLTSSKLVVVLGSAAVVLHEDTVATLRSSHLDEVSTTSR